MALKQAPCFQCLLVFVLTWSISQGIPLQGKLNVSGGGSIPQTMSKHKYANAGMRRATPDIHGISAVLNVWMPKTEDYDLSVAQVWIANDIFPHPNVETIEAGWLVYPNHFEGTKEPRLFAFYTTDNYTRTLCYNMDSHCKFVSVGGRFNPGMRLPYSRKGRDQVEIKIEIKLDMKSKKWVYSVNDTEVGYWPTEVFKGLSKGANILDWGGEVVESRVSNHPTTTEMGSGSFPLAYKDKRAAYFKDIFYIDAKGNKVPPSKNEVLDKATDEECYSIITEGQPPIYYYGGPGGNSKTCKKKRMTVT